MVQKCVSKGAIIFLAQTRLISEALDTHISAQLCEFWGTQIAHRPLLQCAITRFELRNWFGMSGLTPLLLLTHLSEYAILNYLATLSNPQINPT
jgi:hypothetical protein